MAFSGPIDEIAAYVVGALVLLGFFSLLSVRAYGKAGVLLSLGLAATLFIAFKAGFIRHPGHSQIAAVVMLLAGCVPVLIFGFRRAAVCIISGLITWAYIFHHYGPIGPGSIVARLDEAVSKSWSGISTLVTDPSNLHRTFVASRERVRNRYRCPLHPELSTSIPAISPASSRMAKNGRPARFFRATRHIPQICFRKIAIFSMARLLPIASISRSTPLTSTTPRWKTV